MPARETRSRGNPTRFAAVSEGTPPNPVGLCGHAQRLGCGNSRVRELQGNLLGGLAARPALLGADLGSARQLALDAPQTVQGTLEAVGATLVERGACFCEAILGE